MLESAIDARQGSRQHHPDPVQQPINCCNVTSLAYALSALGHPTTVDEIFYVTRLPIASVLDDGMTLAET